MAVTPEADLRSLLVQALRVLTRGRTYLNLFYLALSLPLAAFYFVVLFACAVAGAILSIVGIGLLILLAGLAAAWGFGMLERELAISLLVPSRAAPLAPWPRGGRSVHRVGLPALQTATSFAARRMSRRIVARRRGMPCSSPTLERPAAFVDQPVVRPAEQGEVRQRRLAASYPPDEVMSVTPGQRPRAARPDTVSVARFEGAPGRSGQRPHGVIELVLELALARQSGDRRIARVALDGFRRNRASAFDLAGGCARDTGQGVEASPDDQLRSRPGAVSLA
jgi:hypothetical protein